MKEKFCAIKDEIKILRNFEKINEKCNICLKKTHLSNECGKIHYIPEKDFLIKKLNYFSGIYEKYC